MHDQSLLCVLNDSAHSRLRLEGGRDGGGRGDGGISFVLQQEAGWNEVMDGIGHRSAGNGNGNGSPYWSLLQDLASPASAERGCFSDSPTQSEVDDLLRRGNDQLLAAEERKEEGDALRVGESGTDCSEQEEVDVKPAAMAGGRGRRRQYACGTASKNLVSERKRRKRLNDGLYALRALVPKISKMDKASIVGDAIEYVRELQQQVHSLQSDICDIESDSQKLEGSGLPFSETGIDVENKSEAAAAAASFDNQDRSNQPQHTLLQLDVSHVDRGAFQLRIFCKQGPGVLVQLMQALDASGLDVLNANLTCFKENVLNTFIAEMKDGEMTEEEIKATVLKMAAQFGLCTTDTAQ